AASMRVNTVTATSPESLMVIKRRSNDQLSSQPGAERASKCSSRWQTVASGRSPCLPPSRTMQSSVHALATPGDFARSSFHEGCGDALSCRGSPRRHPPLGIRLQNATLQSLTLLPPALAALPFVERKNVPLVLRL